MRVKGTMDTLHFVPVRLGHPLGHQRSGSPCTILPPEGVEVVVSQVPGGVDGIRVPAAPVPAPPREAGAQHHQGPGTGRAAHPELRGRLQTHRAQQRVPPDLQQVTSGSGPADWCHRSL